MDVSVADLLLAYRQAKVTFDTFEVTEHIIGGINRRHAVIEAISASFDDDIWVERNMFSINGVQKYAASWEQFCDAVKHEAKHGPGGQPEDEDHDTIPSGPSSLKQYWIPERGARMTRRNEREYREYLSEEQRSQPGCPARKAVVLQ